MSDEAVEANERPRSFPVMEVLAVCLGAGMILALHKEGKLIRLEWLALMAGFIPIFFLIRKYQRVRPRDPEETDLINRRMLPGLILLGFAILSLFSSHLQHKWYYLINWTDVGAPLNQFHKLGVVRFVLLTAILTPILVRYRTGPGPAILLIFLFVQAACIYRLWLVTGGEAVFRDDHSSFIFRFWTFSETWPRYLNYNPWWNAGRFEHFGTASGVNSMALFVAPLLKIAEPQKVYTLCLTVLYLVIIPWVTIGSIRMMGGNLAACFAGGIFALGTTRYFFLWFLHYGTVGANFAMAFIIPTTACIYRVLVLNKREKWLCVALAFSVFFLMGWPPGAIVLGCFGVGLLLLLNQMTSRKLFFFIAAATLFLLLFSKPLYIVLVHSSTFKSTVAEVVQTAEPTDEPVLTKERLVKGRDHLRAHLREGHPLLLFLGILGVFFHPVRAIRVWYGPAMAILMVIIGWVRYYFPDLQLHRMSIPLFFVSVPPAALWIGQLFAFKNASLGFFRAALIALLLLGGLSVSEVYRNQTEAPYDTMTPETKELVHWIKENTTADGRILFAGSTEHKYGRAHVAGWPVYTRREMMACDYYAFSQSEVEYEYPPRRYWGREAEFFDLYNVSHVIAYKKHWTNFFLERPDEYEVKSIEHKGIHIYKRKKHQANWFVKGTGTLDNTFNRFDIRLHQDTDEVVLKYHWEEGLSVSGQAELFPYTAMGDILLIGIRPKGERELRVEFKSWL